MGNKAIKIKLASILRGKERKKRKNRYAKLNRGKEDLYTLRINCMGNSVVGKANKGINVKKKNRFKKIKIKEKKKGNATKLQKPNIEAEVYNNKKCD